MRRTYGLVIVLSALLLIGVAAARSIPAAGHPAPVAPATGANAPAAAGTAEAGYTRKLPPPANSVKPAPPSSNTQPSACTAPVVNVSASAGNEDESYVVVNPTNTNNIVAFSNLPSNSIFRAYTMNGGTTWTRGTVATNVACCDGQAAFDNFGNLFLVYISGSLNQINVILSTDGGVTFSAPVLAGSGTVDQPSIAVGNGSVWVDWNLNGNMQVRGAPVTGLGTWGSFNAVQAVPTGSGSYGSITVGPGPNGGKVMMAYQGATGGQGPTTIYVNVDPDGLGPGLFGPRITATTTNVGGYDFIPPQSGRSIDAESGLVWDSTGGPFNNRAYLVYTEETVNENNDTEIYLRTSTDDGTTWSAPVRVNDDPLGPIRSQFLPYIALDHSTGTVAIGWQDSRNDNGVPGTGGTNNTPNDDAEYYASYSTNGGVTWAANQRLSGGFSNAAAAAADVDYGDYEGEDAAGGKFYAVFADNANCDGTNPAGTLHAFDLYMGTMTLPAQGTPTPGTPAATATSTAPPTNTAPPTGTAQVTTVATSTATATPQATSCPVQFNDVPVGSTFYDYIRCLACRGIVGGYPCGGPGEPCPGQYYRPGNNVTRGQVSKIVSESAGFADAVPSTQQTFEDVPTGSTFWLWIERLSSRGIIGGYPCGGPFEPCVAPGNRPYFRPGNDVTRGQLSKITSGAAGWTETPTGQTFEDVPVGSTFYLYIERVASRGIVTGYPCGNPGEPCIGPTNRPYFRPNNNATRGQMAKIAAAAFFPGCSTPARQ